MAIISSRSPVVRTSGQSDTVKLKRIFRNLKGAVNISACALNTIACFIPILAMAVVKLLIPITVIRNTMTRWIMTIGEWWIDGNAFIFGSAKSNRWDVRGLEGLSRDRWYLVVANHQTWADILALQTVLNHRIPFLKFFIKRELIWFPFLGIAWWAMDMPFMKRHSKSYLAKHPDKKGEDLRATRIACEKFRTTPTSVINFIEGTRISENKRKSRNSPFENLLPPRAGGVALALSTMGDMFDAILDVTLVYGDGTPPTFWDVACRDFKGVIIHINQRPVEDWLVEGDYTNDREFRRQFHQWLTKLWQEKDVLIADLKREATSSTHNHASAGYSNADSRTL